VKRLLLAAVRLYQRTLAWVVPAQCRFHPSCSDYFAQAVERRGALVGTWLGVRRLLRCHPLGGSGYDPVPEPEEPRAPATAEADPREGAASRLPADAHGS
jgi:hypothetical protein